MLNITLNEEESIAILEPVGQLSKDDFISAARIIDPYLENSGQLKGIIIHVESFPGWESFSSLVAHLKFVRDHHKKVPRVAFATDSPVGKLAESVASHFVNAEIKHFDYNEIEASKKWILED